MATQPQPLAQLGVPQNLRLASVQVLSPTRALATFMADPVPGATDYWWYHEYGSPYAPGLRLIARTPTPSITVGGSPPFIVTPGQPYTVAVFGGDATGRAPVPAVLQVQIPPYVPAPDQRQVVATVDVQLVAYSAQFDVLVGPPLPGGTNPSAARVRLTQHEVLDTGAYEAVFTQEAAQQLGLPNLGVADVAGVGGNAQAYNTQFALYLGDHVDPQVNAVVIPTFYENLFGLRYFIDRSYGLDLNPVSRTLTIYRAG